MDFVKMRSFWIRVGPNPMAGVLMRRDDRDTESTIWRRKACDGDGRDWGARQPGPAALDLRLQASRAVRDKLLWL